MTNLFHQMVESLVEARVVAQEPGDLDFLELDDHRHGLFRGAAGSRAGILFRRPGDFVSIPDRFRARTRVRTWVRSWFARWPPFRTCSFVRADGRSNRRVRLFARVDEEPAGALEALSLSPPHAHPQGVGADPQPRRGRSQGERRLPRLFGSVHDRTISRGRGESEAKCGRPASSSSAARGAMRASRPSTVGSPGRSRGTHGPGPAKPKSNARRSPGLAGIHGILRFEAEELTGLTLTPASPRPRQRGASPR